MAMGCGRTPYRKSPHLVIISHFACNFVPGNSRHTDESGPNGSVCFWAVKVSHYAHRSPLPSCSSYHANEASLLCSVVSDFDCLCHLLFDFSVLVATFWARLIVVPF